MLEGCSVAAPAQGARPIDSLGFLREFGFFAQYAGMTEEQVFEELKQVAEEQPLQELSPAAREVFDRVEFDKLQQALKQFADTMGWGASELASPAGQGRHPDVLLARFDRQRIWCRHTEMDFGPGLKTYERVIREWAAILRGTFEPASVWEHWGFLAGARALLFSGGGRIRVEIAIDGRTHTLKPKVESDWLDVGVLQQINRLIQKSAMQFESVQCWGQDAYVTVLTAEEKRRLEGERGWRFDKL